MPTRLELVLCHSLCAKEALRACELTDATGRLEEAVLLSSAPFKDGKTAIRGQVITQDPVASDHEQRCEPKVFLRASTLSHLAALALPHPAARLWAGHCAVCASVSSPGIPALQAAGSCQEVFPQGPSPGALNEVSCPYAGAV